MKLDEFKSRIVESTPVGTVINNPGGGTSEVVAYTEENIAYIRGKSTINVSFAKLFLAYSHFKGKTVTTSDLKVFAPEIFDSAARPAGHSCNGTFLFLLLSQINIGSEIIGAGVKGNPFGIDIYET